MLNNSILFFLGSFSERYNHLFSYLSTSYCIVLTFEAYVLCIDFLSFFFAKSIKIFFDFNEFNLYVVLDIDGATGLERSTNILQIDNSCLSEYVILLLNFCIGYLFKFPHYSLLLGIIVFLFCFLVGVK